ncbi:MAG: hypothetical protein KatS3mg035_0816 [Bacteroidia bacterium]|nr:MAG: hypothetical protein KatS3mg035_0816 [Bacteroidia bacterium]
MKKILFIIFCLWFTQTIAQQKTFKVEVEQQVVGSNLYIDVFIQKIQGNDFPLGSSNFSFFVNNVDLDLSGVQIDHSQDGPYDAQTDAKYYEMTKGHGSNYLVMNVNSVLNNPSLGQLVTATRTKVGRLVVPILNPAGFNTLTWRIAPTSITQAGYNTWTKIKEYCEYVNPAPDFPLCEVPAKPNLTASNTSVCSGPVTLFSGYSGDNIWYVDGVEIQGVTGNTYTTAQPGNYTVVAKNYSCTSQPSEPIALQGAPATAPTIAGNQLVCINQGNQTYTASSPNGGTFVWSIQGNGASIQGSPSGNSINVVYNQTGTYNLTVTETLNNGCQVTSQYTVNAEASPANPIISIQGSDLVLLNYTSGTIQWYLDGVVIQGANAPTYTPTSNGTYTVQITNSCGSATSDPVSWSVTSAQTFDPSLGFKVYPNPYKGQTHIYYQLSQSSNVNLEVYNMVGQLVHTFVNEKQSAGKYSYEFSATKLNMTAGSYMVKLTVNGKTYTAQIIELK